MPIPSELDVHYFHLARQHIADFRARWKTHCFNMNLKKILEVAPEFDAAWPGADTLNITPGCTYQADITERTPIATGSYDVVIAMEVLEHVLDPFAAVDELDRILQPEGILLVSAPWNFRIHGPIPDLWRFNQNSWRLLLKNFEIMEMDVLDTPGRALMPLHINVAACCNRYAHPKHVKFERIDR